jgi:hypothetical protein
MHSLIFEHTHQKKVKQELSDIPNIEITDRQNKIQVKLDSENDLMTVKMRLDALNIKPMGGWKQFKNNDRPLTLPPDGMDFS